MDLGSEIRDPEKTFSGSRIPDPGFRGQKGTGSRIRIRNTAIHYFNSFAPFAQQAGQATVLGRLSLVYVSGYY
jgi:hypothetical protein